jgi:exodeoxyribonuclease V beta subunit
MTVKMNYLPFDALKAELNGSNLIEASAGTGKTYSIAILALRLILEENISVEKILMVTFTKAAVAELHERVRLFIRLAQKASQGHAIPDGTISAMVESAMQLEVGLVIQERLNDAVLLLDEIEIMTIHSFCQQTLNEFAFETNQLFGAEMFTDLDSVVEQEVNEFWRVHISTMDVEILSLLGFEELRQDIRAIIKEQLEGKHYSEYDADVTYTIEDISIQKYKGLETLVQEESLKHEERVLQAFHKYKDQIAEVCHASKAKSKKEYIACLDDPAAFISLLNNGKENVLTKALPQPFLQVYHESSGFISSAADLVRLNFKSRLYFFAIQQIVKSVKHFLLKNNLLGYNDLIQNLYKALKEQDNSALVAALQEKYKAVFVDEFQDTDREQYEIFRSAFPAPTILFLIGDPKQSIYAWRKADIFTYFMARSNVDRLYSMNVNYRSCEGLIHAMNKFFLPDEAFDTFCFDQQEESIEYFPVESPDSNGKGTLLYEGNQDIPISIFECKNKDAIQFGVADQIQALLTDPAYEIEKGEQRTRIKPSDIGILVRKNADGEAIKKYLSQRGIAAVTINDAKVLGTVEAKEMLYLLEAILEPGLAAINRALLSGFTGFTTDEILQLNEEKVLHYFQQYKTIWIEDGIYPALIKFVKEFEVRERLMEQKAVQGERSVSNLFQLIELLNQAQQYKELSPEELISWLKRGINGMETQGDEYQMRMESDEDAVKIVTIHKSKGLEYKIVFAPFLDMNAEGNFKILKYREPQTGAYIAKEALRLTPEEKAWNNLQQEQENRRLIYVAITRGVYKCFVYKNNAAYFRNSSLTAFLNAIKPVADEQLISIRDLPQYELKPYRQEEDKVKREPLYARHFSLKEENWSKLSYTRISVHGEHIPRERSKEFEHTYDEFVFNKLRFGAATGNLLHQLFEDIDFSKEELWDEIIARTLKSYLPNAQDSYAVLLRQMLDHVLKVSITMGYDTFGLNDIPYYKRISELEFDFPVSALQTNQLSIFGGEGKIINTRSFEGKALEGIMNGKIDLFFEHAGRYYVLDWKSNYLGFKIEDYNKDALLQSMNENNYHLQYLLYTVAVKKYLQSRIPGFDYEKHFGGIIYLFLRGVRKEENTGIFTARPSLKKIQGLENMLNKKIAI